MNISVVGGQPKKKNKNKNKNANLSFSIKQNTLKALLIPDYY